MTARTFYRPGKCTSCHAAYMREYRDNNREQINNYSRDYSRSRRWLNGADCRDDMGPDIGIGTRTIGDVLYITKGRRKIA